MQRLAPRSKAALPRFECAASAAHLQRIQPSVFAIAFALVKLQSFKAKPNASLRFTSVHLLGVTVHSHHNSRSP